MARLFMADDSQKTTLIIQAPLEEVSEDIYVNDVQKEYRLQNKYPLLYTKEGVACVWISDPIHKYLCHQGVIKDNVLDVSGFQGCNIKITYVVNKGPENKIEIEV